MEVGEKEKEEWKISETTKIAARTEIDRANGRAIERASVPSITPNGRLLVRWPRRPLGADFTLRARRPDRSGSGRVRRRRRGDGEAENEQTGGQTTATEHRPRFAGSQNCQAITARNIINIATARSGTIMNNTFYVDSLLLRRRRNQCLFVGSGGRFLPFVALIFY